MLRRFWLVFAQACTLCLAALFVVTTLRPDLLARARASKRGQVVLLQETSTPVEHADASRASPTRRRRRCPRSSTSTRARRCASAGRSPTTRCCAATFPDLAERLPRQRATSLGSGVIVSPEGYVLTNNHVIEGADDIQLVLADGRRIERARARNRSRVRPRGAQGRRRELPGDHVRRARPRAGRRLRARDRQSVRLRQHGDARHRQRARPQPPRHQPLRGLHPDRRGDQSRQFRRRAGRHRRQPDRHQQHDLLAVGRLARHRLRDSGVARAHACWSRSSRTAR